MRYRWLVAAMLALPAFTEAHEADPAYLATLHDEGGLPRSLAPFERLPHFVPPLAPADAPGGHVRAIAEYEPTAGILISWGGFNALHTAMVVPLTTADPPSDVWVVADSASEATTASGGGTSSPPPPPGSTMIGAGADALTVQISQDAFNGSAQYTISVDGTQIGGTLTASALHSSGQSDTVTVLGDWAAGTHTLTVNFINDAYGVIDAIYDNRKAGITDSIAANRQIAGIVQAAVEKGYLKVGASLQLTAPPYYGTGDRPNYGGGR